MQSSTTPPILAVERLTVAYRQGDAWLEAVQDVSLQVHAGEIYGLVGESGSGKTTLLMAILRYLPAGGAVRSGRVDLAGQDLLALDESQMREVWGRQIALVPQNPQSSLNPSLRIGEQVAEVVRYHQRLSHADSERRARELLAMVHIADPARVAASYPHQISGGMQQRVMIAMALSSEPRLLVLDEPTTSLDVTTQAVVLDLVRELIQGRQTAALYVTHNLGVIASLCDRVGVLYAGELVEEAPVRDLFRQPLHPYTQALLESIPQLGTTKASEQLRSIEGRIPSLSERSDGCVFAPRCPLAAEICQQRPALDRPQPQRATRCHRWTEMRPRHADAAQSPAAQSPAALESAPSASVAPASDHDQPPVLAVDQVKVYYPAPRSFRELITGRRRWVKAVDGISASLGRGRTLGVVGESGSGKSTLARSIVGLVGRTQGEVRLLGMALPQTLSARSRETLRHLQMVFQNPEEALNPYLTVGESLRRPAMTLGGKTQSQADAAAAELLASVGLPAAYARRLPSQLSGGEKQRVAIARAFASQPDLLICDEPVSSLDVSVQASILNLLNQLQIAHDSSVLFISHDLAVVGYVADEIAVIYLGRLMQVSPAAELFKPPYHPYTEALLSAVPLPDPLAPPRQIRLEGDIPSPTQVRTGCPFHSRCPRSLGHICADESPPWQEAGAGTRIFCHIPLDELLRVQQPLGVKPSAGQGSAP